MGNGFSSMSTKWRVFSVIGIISVAIFALQIAGLLITAAVAGAAAGGAVLASKK